MQLGLRLRAEQEEPHSGQPAGGRLVRQLIARCPAHLEVLCGAIDDYTDQLHPIEAQAIELAVTRRRHEFSTGRWLARQALARLGLPPVSIPIGPEREPQWPRSAVGSLSHSASTCVVAMAPARTFEGVGIDMELGSALDPDVTTSILADGESAYSDSPELVRLAFSAKEAVFKCQFARYRRFIEYRDVEIEIDAAARAFRAATRSRELRPLRLDLGRGIYEMDTTGVLTLFTQARHASADDKPCS